MAEEKLFMRVDEVAAVLGVSKSYAYKLVQALNKELKSGKYEYKYPHDYPNGYVKQQYLPDSLKDKTYYNPKDTGSYERAIKEYMNKLKA